MKNNKGFTIIEVMIAVVILGMGMMAAVQLYVSCAKNNRNGNVLSIAMMAAKERMESLRGQNVEDLIEGTYSDQVGLTTVEYTIVKDPNNARLGRAVVTASLRNKRVRIETRLNNWNDRRVNGSANFN